ncbi:MAG: phosphatidylglycerol lysyltransferase domain-containing protein [Dehalococcoidia bacterium]|nr:phosphatidylglycerol lysyltransferase domain-containing protein [Dehalococcoidia bacterium]
MSILQMVFAQVDLHSRSFSYVLPFGLQYWGRSLTVLFGFMLIYLSLNLFGRRRMAWWLAVVASVLLVAAHIQSGRLWYLAIAPALACVLLLVFRGRFTVRSDSSSIRRGIGLMLVSLSIAVVYGTLGFWYLDRRDFGLEFSLGDSVVRTLRQITLIGNSDLVAHTRQASWFLESLSAVGIAAWAVAAYSLFRPVTFRLQVLPHERALAQAILERHGRSSYDFFKLWPAKSYFFSESKRSFVAYATFRGVALSLGDPSGPEDELEDVTKSFLDHCYNNGWTVCFLFPDLLPMYRRLGLGMLKIGEEAVVDLQLFSSQTGHKKYFRYHQHRFEREGYSFSRYKPPHPGSLLDEVEKVSDAWLKLPKHRELGFVEGHFDRSYMEKTTICVVRDRSGQAVGFLNESPSYRKDEASFDLLRHIPGVPNATMDYLMQQTLFALRGEGYRWFNMGIAPFAGLGNRLDAPLTEKALSLLFRIHWFVSNQGLHDYKVKFEPVWQDRFIAYHGGTPGLVRIALAINKAIGG